MIINDTPQIEKNLAERLNENQLASLQTWIDEQTVFSKAVDDPATSPLATMNKIGKPMSHVELERKLKTLAPSLKFIWGEFGTIHKKMVRILPDGETQDLMIYNTGMMTERSIWRHKIVWLPDPKYKPSSRDNDEFYEWVPRTEQESARLFSDIGVDFAFNDDPVRWSPNGHKDPFGAIYGKWQLKDPNVRGPGWIKHLEPLGEQQRGWRSVLVRLVASGVLTTAQVESNFGNDNTPEWKQHMGFGPATRPW